MIVTLYANNKLGSLIKDQIESDPISRKKRFQSMQNELEYNQNLISDFLSSVKNKIRIQ